MGEEGGGGTVGGRGVEVGVEVEEEGEGIEGEEEYHYLHHYAVSSLHRSSDYLWFDGEKEGMREVGRLVMLDLHHFAVTCYNQ